jgi:phosphate transport system permease protein
MIEAQAAARHPVKIKKTVRLADRVFPRLTFVGALVIIAILVNILVILLIQAWPSISHFGASFLGTSIWNPVTDVYGAWPAIFGTLLTSLLALAIAVPVSLGTAIFLVEIAPAWFRESASFVIEILATIPSVIIGIWGIFVLVPFVRAPLESWLSRVLGFLPFFQGAQIGYGFLAAGIILSIMIIPIITAISCDVIRAVPSQQREAMLALGATRWETISRAVLPYGRSGLVGGIILGLGRALGETMAVTMVIGNAFRVSPSLFSPGATIASWMAGQFGEASGLSRSALIELGLMLFIITLIVNVIARLLVWRLAGGREARE